MNKKNVVKLKIKMGCEQHREAMVQALAGEGYCVWIEEKERAETTDYFVCFIPSKGAPK